ncbi:stage III sporulation protein AG [Gottschalkia acidurici 9a]|uniref:Stage III sporulation protein AG n=1 Tax=Gottschalkia acidurici (strain ATCC 7906 / DSM 604 / BCRC 14475 / CIP 104303 / KCTC 5404 / NCIMB 10678 / 9a) TaxID=1128398 RepID=K0AX81_GOTA9|nr:stage III sporulation protein AG [Gottschalkia acidurici]AFS78388.1 stage III sporulation protein AG [Gottschalkia acidurici 9a]
MLEKIKDKIKEFMNKDNSKKFITNLTIAICIGIGLIILSDTLLPNKETVSKSTHDLDYVEEDQENKIKKNLIEDYSDNMEFKLKEILSEIKGVGEVKIMINLEDTAEIVPAFNTTTVNEQTNENDAQGGVRTVSRDDSKQEVVTSKGDSLMVIKEVKPNVKGVIVVAEGAENIEVKEKLYSAVKTVLGISGNKVEVYSSK